MDIDCANCNVVTLTGAELAARRIERIDGGRVYLPSGRLVVSDLDFERLPYTRTVPPGTYPVELYVHGRVGVAAVRFAHGDLVKWELAVVPGQDVATLAPGYTFGFPCDTGLAVLFDADHAPVFDERLRAVGDPDASYFDDVLLDELGEDGSRPHGLLVHTPFPERLANAVIFDAGWGDGYYSAFWGLDASGRALVLAIDFDVFKDADARDEWERKGDERAAALTDTERSGQDFALRAIESGRLDQLETLLKSGMAHPERYIPTRGATLTFEAVRLDRPEALALLIRYGSSAEMPDYLRDDGQRTYEDYARSLDLPRSAALLSVLATLR